MAANGFQSSYNVSHRPPSSQGSGGGDTEIGSDPASNSFFSSDYRK